MAVHLGKGRVILCRESVDAAEHDNPSVGRWHQRWLAELNREGAVERIPTPPLEKLVRWWVGQEAIAGLARTVTWLEGNQRRIRLSLDTGRPLGEVLVFVLPPTGKVEDVRLRMEASGKGQLTFDFGCDSRPDGKVTCPGPGVIPADAAGTVRWSENLARSLETTSFRDDNRWRLVPVRITTTNTMELTIKDIRVLVR